LLKAARFESTLLTLGTLAARLAAVTVFG